MFPSHQRLIAAVLASSCWVAGARAEPRVDELVELDYELDPGLEDCPNEDQFEALVSHSLGQQVALEGTPPGVEVRVRSTTTGLEGTIQWQSFQPSQGQRQVSSPLRDCQRLVAALAFVLAVQIELMSTERAAQLESAPKRDETPVVPPPDDARARPSDPAPQPLALAAGLGAEAGVGVAPRPVLQGRAFGSLRLGAASLELGIEGRPAVTTSLGDGRGFRHHLLAGTLAACWHVEALSACGFTKIGGFQVTGEGVDRPASPTALVVQVGPRIAYAFAFDDRFGVLAHVDGSYLLSPWTVRLDGARVWEMPRFGAVAGIDAVARFR